MADREGTSCFDKDEKGDILRSYSAYARGIDIADSACNFFDLTSKGRDEKQLEFTQA